MNRLDAIEERADDAQQGPWTAIAAPRENALTLYGVHGSYSPICNCYDMFRENAEFVAHARTDLPVLAEAVAAVVAVLDGELAEPGDIYTETLARRLRTAIAPLLTEETP